MKGKIAIWFGLALVGLTVVYGCGATSGGGGGGAEYFPLTNGSQWVYASTNGTSMISTVEGTASLWSKTYSVINSASLSVSGSVVGTSESLCRTDSAGLYVGSRYSSSEMKYLDFPLTAGKSWKMFDNGVTTYEALIVSSGNLAVSAGNFACYRVRYHYNYLGSISTTEIWYGENVGFVKITNSSTTDVTTLQSVGGAISITPTTTTSTSTTTSTGGSGPTTTLASAAYFPLTNGNRWVSTYSSGTSQINTIEGTVSLWSRTYSIINSTYLNNYGVMTSTGEGLYRMTGAGVFSGSRYSTLEMTVLEFPLAVGNSWLAYDSGSSSMEATIISNGSLTVPAGSFNCYKVRYVSRYTGYVGTSEIWFGANAGIVKIVSGSTTIEMQSKNY